MDILGEIRSFAFDQPINNWMECNGQPLLIDEHPALFALLGHRYGGGGGYFLLPSIQAEVLVGMAPDWPLGTKRGDATASIRDHHLPTHRHAYRASTLPADSAMPGPRRVHAATALGKASTPGAPRGLAYVRDAAVTTRRAFVDRTLASGAQPGISLDNRMPALGLSVRICIHGEQPILEN